MENVPTTITVSFPSWFYVVLTGGMIAVVFYLGQLHHQIKSVCCELPRIQQSLIRISEGLLTKKITNDRLYVASHSPIQLTDEGLKAISESGFDAFYQANKNALIERVKRKNPKTIADLEEACKEVMLSMEDTMPSFDLLKRFAYERGEPISNILFASAVALRDKLFKELFMTE